jgi:type II secretory pathway pseudopilin PulG
MGSSSRQHGSALILVVAVVTTLAILATTLTAVVINVQGNTARDRGRTKAFNVAEAGLDSAQDMLLGLWPTSPETVPTFSSSNFRSQFSLAEFPKPATGDFITIRVRDDLDSSQQYDNGNGILVIDSTARVGKSSAHVQVQVQRIPEDFHFRPGVVYYGDGWLTLDGKGSDIPFDSNPPGTMATVYAKASPSPGYTSNGAVQFPTGTITVNPPGYEEVTMNDIFPSTLRDELIKLADKYGNRVTAADVNQALWLKAFTEYPHVVAITGGGTLKITDADVPSTGWPPAEAGGARWMFGPGPNEPLPGILIVEDATVEFAGNEVFWGLIYVKNGFVDAGTTEIHGMVVTEGTGTVSGTRSIIYDPNVVANLDKLIPSSVRIIPNTWKELPAN